MQWPKSWVTAAGIYVSAGLVGHNAFLEVAELSGQLHLEATLPDHGPESTDPPVKDTQATIVAMATGYVVARDVSIAVEWRSSLKIALE